VPVSPWLRLRPSLYRWQGNGGSLSTPTTRPAGRRPGSFPHHASFEVIPLHQAARRTREFEHVVIDTNAGLRADELKEIVEACDLLITPTTPDALSYQALMVTVGIIQNIKSAHYKALLTIIPPRPSRDGDDMRVELDNQSIPLFKTGIRRFVAYQKAALSGVPVYESNDPRALEAWEDYLSLGKEILP
jgi:chromosome partitioning protein